MMILVVTMITMKQSTKKVKCGYDEGYSEGKSQYEDEEESDEEE